MMPVVAPAAVATMTIVGTRTIVTATIIAVVVVVIGKCIADYSCCGNAGDGETGVH